MPAQTAVLPKGTTAQDPARHCASNQPRQQRLWPPTCVQRDLVAFASWPSCPSGTISARMPSAASLSLGAGLVNKWNHWLSGNKHMGACWRGVCSRTETRLPLCAKTNKIPHPTEVTRWANCRQTLLKRLQEKLIKNQRRGHTLRPLPTASPRGEARDPTRHIDAERFVFRPE
jgi:hypothetical protein